MIMTPVCWNKQNKRACPECKERSRTSKSVREWSFVPADQVLARPFFAGAPRLDRIAKAAFQTLIRCQRNKEWRRDSRNLLSCCWAWRTFISQTLGKVLQIICFGWIHLMHQRRLWGSGMVVSGLDGLFCCVTVLLSGRIDIPIWLICVLNSLTFQSPTPTDNGPTPKLRQTANMNTARNMRYRDGVATASTPKTSQKLCRFTSWSLNSGNGPRNGFVKNWLHAKSKMF